ncbi:hypothetical protein MMC21_003685 [Puttea exsequens]|nr:hypothetical protein [Puttea exsequens]
MFSRGNISEKARILKLDSLTEAILGARPEETSAVDLYAGIGYFTFCYASMRVERVLCWEINGWSIEGLRRGAEGNGWGVRVVEEGEEWRGGGERVVVFREGNVDAGWRVEAVREMIPPVRHVNCGFLPSSRGGWEGAVRVLDRAGGWIHAHENIALRDVERRKREIVDVLVQLVESRYGSDPREKRKIDCEHLEQVKSYAPGIMHCVLDIRIALAADAP